MNYLYEGRLFWGEPFGFGRLISDQEFTAIGFFKDITTLYGKGVYYPSNSADTVAKMGYYPSDGAQFLTEDPTAFNFRHFMKEKKKEAVIIKRASIKLGGKCIASEEC